ncbi:MAG: superoxide dismutase family protein [Chitinophagaceae bacterium]
MKESFLFRISIWILVVSIFAWSCNDENKTSETTTTDSLEVSKTDTIHNNMNMAPDTASQPMADRAEAVLSGTYPDTAVSGTVKFENASDGKVKMMLDITVVAKAGKSVAVHIHEHGDCSDMGNMAHGHWNPTNAEHGKWGSGSFHSGDIGNVKLDSKGKGTIKLETDLWTLGGKHDKNILNKAIIVHGGVDDFKTQPTGDAGTRIGCGVIK